MQPPATARAGDNPVALEHAERSAHGWTLGCDEIGKYRVRQPDGKDHTVADDRTPAIGQVPQQHVKTCFDLALVHDRHVHREGPGPS